MKFCNGLRGIRYALLAVGMSLAGFATADPLLKYGPLDQAVAQPLTRSAERAPVARTSRNSAWWTDAGHILAGEVPNAGSALGRLVNRSSVRAHRDEFVRSWPHFETSRLRPAMKFAKNEVATQQAANGPILYPFSGPDAMYALGMFPNAASYALFGLEPVGELPDLATLSEADLNASLAEMRRSLRSLKALSFFRTNDMRVEFSHNRFSGVTPILLLFITRQGYAVQSVEPLVMRADGRVQVTDVSGLKSLGDGGVPGVRLSFMKQGDLKLRTLYYFSADLSDGGLAKTPQTMTWMASFAPRATYLKSASYLMHAAHFSQIRKLILSRSELIVQDDSGIPLRYFPAANWERTFFGTYDGPIRLFGNRYQKELRVAYETSARPLEFGIGYDHQAKASNIQRFLRKPRAGDRLELVRAELPK